nr:protein kinase [Kofleriaceae bacterium]
MSTPSQGGDALAPGTRLGKYRLARTLGAGGMGVVWAAHDPDLEREVALKLLRARGNDSRARLMREARAMAKLKHANVLTVYEVGSVGGRDYIAMELVDGGSLDAWFGTRPPRAEVVRTLIAAGRGLAAAHAAGLVHRDFKPQNVLRSSDGRVLVTDFGLARGVDDTTPISVPPPDLEISSDNASAVALEATLAAPTGPSAKLTRTGALVGTPAYMAPEQFDGGPPNARTDQYAWCITAWQAMTGKRPFAGATIEALARATATGVRDVAANLPRRVRAVLERGLAPEPADRWPDVEVMLREFERAASPRRRARIAAAVAVGAVALVGIGAVAFPRSNEEPPPSTCDDPAAAFPATAPAAARDVWAAAVGRACVAEPALRDSTLACLIDQRDRIALAGPGPIPDDIAVGGCRVALSPVPSSGSDSASTLATIHRLRLATVVMRSSPYDDKVAAAAIADARATGWRPVELELELVAAAAAHRDGDDAAAQRVLDDALLSARSLDDEPREAIARVALLEVEARRLPAPDNPNRLATDIRDARITLDHIHGDTRTGLRLATALAEIDVGQHQLDEAIATLDDARARFAACGDDARSRGAAWLEVDALLERATAGDLDRAAAIAPGSTAAFGDHEAEDRVPRLARELARRRDDLAAMRAAGPEDRDWPEAVPPNPIVSTTHRSGRVVDAAGAPVAGARVVGFQRFLDGDAREVDAWVTVPPSDPTPMVVATTTDASGAFTLPRASYVIAERGRERTAAVDFGDGVRLQMLPTIERRGHLALGDRAPDPSLYVRAVHPLKRSDDGVVLHAWSETAPVDAHGDYVLANLPPGDYQVYARASAGRDALRTRLLVGSVDDWQDDITYDVVVRTTSKARYAWLLVKVRNGIEQPDVLAQPELADDRVVAREMPVGARDVTGQRAYMAGDYHAVIHGPIEAVEICTETEKQVGCQATWTEKPDDSGTVFLLSELE